MQKTPEEIQCMRESATILSKVHGEIASAIKPGISEIALNDIAEKAIQRHGAQPSFKGINGFPATICISTNDEVVHGKPTSYILQTGDIVTVDCGVFYKGFHSDCAFTHIVGLVTKELLHLLAVTRQAMYKGIEAMKSGNTLGDIGHAIQYHIEKNSYNIVKEYTGHGIGRKLHEAPHVPNHGIPGKGTIVEEGMVLAIEPIATIGKPDVYEPSMWEVRTRDKKPACHFEHTVAVVNGQPEILTTFDYIEKKKTYK